MLRDKDGLLSENTETIEMRRRDVMRKAATTGALATLGAGAVSSTASATDHVERYCGNDTYCDHQINNWSKSVGCVVLDSISSVEADESGDGSGYYRYNFTLDGAAVGRRASDSDSEANPDCSNRVKDSENEIISNQFFKCKLRTTDGPWTMGDIKESVGVYPGDSDMNNSEEEKVEQGMDFAFDFWDAEKLSTAFTAYQVVEKFNGRSNYTEKPDLIKLYRESGAFSPAWSDAGHTLRFFVDVPADPDYHCSSGCDPDLRVFSKFEDGNLAQEWNFWFPHDGSTPDVTWTA